MGHSENDFFLNTDVFSDRLLDWEIPNTWWSRRYEYPWAIKYAGEKFVAADLGCGWHFRPFKDALAKLCKHVYAVDNNERVLDLSARYKFAANMTVLVADIEKETQILSASIDRAFSISVIEELGDQKAALTEMRRMLRPEGLAILTFDVTFNKDLPQGRYKGIAVDKILELAASAGLIPRSPVNKTQANRICNKSLNLCVYHLVLKGAV